MLILDVHCMLTFKINNKNKSKDFNNVININNISNINSNNINNSN